MVNHELFKNVYFEKIDSLVDYGVTKKTLPY
jgi:hypothetical protein